MVSGARMVGVCLVCAWCVPGVCLVCAWCVPSVRICPSPPMPTQPHTPPPHARAVGAVTARLWRCAQAPYAACGGSRRRWCRHTHRCRRRWYIRHVPPPCRRRYKARCCRTSRHARPLLPLLPVLIATAAAAAATTFAYILVFKLA